MPKPLIILVCAVLTLAAASTGFWFTATLMIERRMAQWATDAAEFGWTVRGQGPSGALCPCQASGWPFAAELAVAAPTVSGGAQIVPGGMQWQAGRVLVTLSLLHPLTAIVTAEGSQSMRISHAPPLVMQAAVLEAQVPIGPSPGTFVTVHTQGMAGGVAGSGHPQDVRVDELSLRAAPGKPDRPGTDLQLEFSGRGIQLPDIGRWPLGATIARVSGAMSLSSPKVPFWDALAGAGGGGARAQAEAWRDGGGSLRVTALDLHWGPVTLHGTARLTLDVNLQPAGEGSVDAKGVSEALDALVASGVMSTGMETTTKAVVWAMPHVPDSEAVRLSLLLHDKTLSVGGIPVTELGQIRWNKTK